MEVRGRLAFLVCALAALLALPTASAAAGKTAEVRLSTIKLEGSNGYEIEVSALPESWISPAAAAVTVDNGPSRAAYEVKPEAGAGIHATFGSLGQLDVTFERKSKTIETPEPECRWITEKGVFRGSFRFTGEGGYVTSEAVDPSGEVTRLPNGFCGLGGDRPARLAIPGLRETVLDAETKEGNRSVFFEASRLEQSRAVLFRAVLSEHVGDMKIWRSAHTAGRSWRFVSVGSTGAGVSPPKPFLGTARFRNPVNGPPTWDGSLAVSFPGAPDTPLARGSFVAKLCSRLAVLRHCLREPAGDGLESLFTMTVFAFS